ncbi:PPW family C-terminal domain-containing PPE protein [Mycobacterium persicum]|uniref:PPW family C-terminal domain-containing PPE protein n=1 Tax=Mycobacterium persicum TaxID=1487726 RepID=UPI001C616720
MPGQWGFAGTVQQGAGVQAGGLATVRDVAFGNGAPVPMLPPLGMRNQSRQLGCSGLVFGFSGRLINT